MKTLTKEKPVVDWSTVGSIRDLLKAENAEEILCRKYKSCDCEIPHLVRKWNAALGVFIEIRLCCMAKALEKLTGEKFYDVFEFEPEWVWDCEDVVEKPDGTKKQKGNPPSWLLKRMKERGIKVKNLK